MSNDNNLIIIPGTEKIKDNPLVDKLGEVLRKFGESQQAVDQLQNGLVQLYSMIQQLNFGLQIRTLETTMMMNIMIDKNLLTREEADQYHKRFVRDVIEKANSENKEVVEDSKEEDSNIVLASEKNNVIKFPTREE